jgi:uracil-DNA glycosylase
MFVVEAPSQQDANTGTPLADESGRLLRETLEALKFTEVDYYVTYAVTCRACEKAIDGEGRELVRKDYKTKKEGPVWRDSAPLPVHLAACRPRLLEEVYLVDPLLIVTLGALATEAVMGSPRGITESRGKLLTMEVEGASSVALVTEKRQLWARKVGGVLVRPTAPYKVKYSVLPTFHPAYVLRKIVDRGSNSPMQLFLRDLKLVASMYEMFLLEVFGVTSAGRGQVESTYAEALACDQIAGEEYT